MALFYWDLNAHNDTIPRLPFLTRVVPGEVNINSQQQLNITIGINILDTFDVGSGNLQVQLEHDTAGQGGAFVLPTLIIDSTSPAIRSFQATAPISDNANETPCYIDHCFLEMNSNSNLS